MEVVRQAVRRGQDVILDVLCGRETEGVLPAGEDEATDGETQGREEMSLEDGDRVPGASLEEA